MEAVQYSDKNELAYKTVIWHVMIWKLRQNDIILTSQLRYYLKNMNIEDYQQQIFQLNCDLERISVLERKSRARLQIVHRHNKCYIRSINDKYKNLRILLLGLIINFHHNKGNDRINRLKNIIYQSELQHLTESRGLLKQELHKSFAINLNQARLGDNFQNEIIKCFNCVAFFDEVLMSSFKQYFVPTDLEPFESWQHILGKTFDIQIRVRAEKGASESYEERRGDFIELQRGNDCLYLPSGHKESEDTDTIIDVSSVSLEEIEIEKGQNLLTVSIDNSCDSPYLINKENFNSQNLQKVIQKSNKITPFEPRLELSKSRRTKKQSSFWAFFCCSVD